MALATTLVHPRVVPTGDSRAFVSFLITIWSTGDTSLERGTTFQCFLVRGTILEEAFGAVVARPAPRALAGLACRTSPADRYDDLRLRQQQART
jgi:hypothetical protein